jgi:parallel beta-helix repeat protein
MKRTLQKSALAILAIAILLGFGLVAMSATRNVPGTYETITEALEAAVAGDTIAVAAGYNSEEEGETFPITVTLDNITITGASGATLRVPSSSAGVVFKGVTGGKLQGFSITSEEDADPEVPSELGDIGVVVKESTNVTVKANTIYNLLSGIRLINASYNTIQNNTVYDIGADTDTTTAVERNGIGIFLEVSDNNTLSGNEVYDSGVGLFVFESAYNNVVGDSYHDNTLVGVDLNDSSRNGLDGLSVKDNGTWGIFLVMSAENLVENCEVSGNELGGIELAGSSLNTIRGNYIHDNGNATGDNFQLVLATGDKALFTSPIFDAEQALGEIDKIRDKKHMVEWQVDLFEDWLIDIDEELIEIEQKILIARGMCTTSEPQSASIVLKIEQAIDEKHCIVGEYGTDDFPEAYDPFIGNLSDASHRPGFETLLTDPMYNFSLPDADEGFQQQFDSLYVAKPTPNGEVVGVVDPQTWIFDGTEGWVLVTDKYEGTKYPLTKMKILVLFAKAEGILTVGQSDLDDIMKGRETDFPLPKDTESLTKAAILHILGGAMY